MVSDPPKHFHVLIKQVDVAETSYDVGLRQGIDSLPRIDRLWLPHCDHPRTPSPFTKRRPK